LREQRAKLEGRGVHVLAVAFESAEQVGDFVARDKPGFPVLRDPERAAYRAFGFGRPGALRIWAPRTLAFYARKLLRGQLPRHFQSDPFQLGGDVLVGPEGSPCWVYRSDEPADRPSVDSILQVLERLRPR
jgi:hypothetical protein